METELAGASFMFNASGARATITKVEFIEKKGIRFKDGKGVKFSDGKRGYSSPGTYGSVYRCYFLADDGEKAIENRFKPGNLVRSQSFNIKEGAYDGVSNHYWWRLVENVGDNWIEVSVNHCDEGSDIPKVGDVMVQLGDIADPDYQSAIVLSAYGDGAPIPGKAAVGIEVPNKETLMVSFRELVDSPEFKNHPSNISFCVGKDIGGNVTVADIAKMPHLLIAGATGSGKSVCINTIIMSILYKADPKDVKLIMVDPKVVELSIYNGIPHLLIPVVTDPKKAAGALHWAVAEMTDRYQKFAEANVRDLKGYNAKIDDLPDGEDKPEKLPQIVIIVDELADLMMVAASDVEESICRLAQLARACGIHLIIATQRPSVNVITGLIKANMPSRIAFAVTSGIDSRTILDMNGAEKLLGKGDMLFDPQGVPKPLRVQGAFVSDKEVSDVVAYIKEENGQVSYNSSVEEQMNSIESGNTTVSIDSGQTGDGRDPYFADAAKLLIDKEKGSIGMLQRYFKVGFNRAARIMDQLEEAGIVGPEEGTKPRKVLMSPEQFEQYEEEYL
jgi:S-DNA-T family DNA segregation ATPase FtsK/SpoIIIE